MVNESRCHAAAVTEHRPQRLPHQLLGRIDQAELARDLQYFHQCRQTLYNPVATAPGQTVVTETLYGRIS